MKQNLVHRIAIVTLLFALTVPATARVFPKQNASEKVMTEAESARMQELMMRLEYLKSMDKSALTSSEKKNLRNEVTDIKRDMKETSGGVYLSVAAIIIIILLLILLL